MAGPARPFSERPYQQWREAFGAASYEPEVANRFIQKLREIELFKVPGVAETIDWASALTELDKIALDPETVSDTIGVLLNL